MPACVSLVRNGVGIPAYRPTPTRIMPRSISARPVLWNTIYVEAVLEQFRKEGYPVNEEDKARLSPLIHEHINTQGRHSFVMPEAVVKGELRPLRNPADDLD